MVELNERARPMTWFRPVFLVAVALCATAFADEGLIGSWVGASGDNEGERVVVERGAVTIEGERLPLRFVGPGLLEIGPPGDTAQLRYRLVGDTLTKVEYQHKNWHGYLAGFASGLTSALANLGGVRRRVGRGSGQIRGQRRSNDV